MKGNLRFDFSENVAFIFGGAGGIPGEGTYTILFEDYEKKISETEQGTFNEVPSESDIPDLLTISFLVNGLHSERETEVMFIKKTMVITPEREESRIMDFQKAVIARGRIP